MLENVSPFRISDRVLVNTIPQPPLVSAAPDMALHPREQNPDQFQNQANEIHPLQDLNFWDADPTGKFPAGTR
jgi:hypothetical protein